MSFLKIAVALAFNHAIAYRIDSSEFGESTAAIYVAYNGWSGKFNFTLLWLGQGKNWYRVTNTSNWNEGNSVKTSANADFIGVNGPITVLMVELCWS